MENTLQTAQPSRATVMAETRTTAAELKRGALLNTVAMLAANFRAVFTILVARLLGPVALGIFSVAWAAVDLISKAGILGLDDGVTTFVARANALKDRPRCRGLLRAAATIAVGQSTVVAAVLIFSIPAFGHYLHLEPQMIPAIKMILFALPGIALYRISTSVSRGMKVMEHDIYSRGFTESGVTTLAFLVAFALGSRIFAPEIAAIIGASASGVVAFLFASALFRDLPDEQGNTAFGHARDLLAYSLPIGADQFLNAFIWRIDVILLGFLVGHVAGVTLTTLGIYGAVVGIANGLRKVSQSFTPIFAPVVAGMTAVGDQEQARATYAQLAQWMLWILLPLVAVLVLGGNIILLIFGHAFQNGSAWLALVALACATNAFINLGETVIMVQRPRLNLLNSIITCIVGTGLTFLLILRFGVTGAAIGILATYLVQGLVRNLMLRLVFRWRSSWRNFSAPVYAAVIASIPAVLAYFVWHGVVAGQAVATILFLVVFGALWQRHRSRSRNRNLANQ